MDAKLLQAVDAALKRRQSRGNIAGRLSKVDPHVVTSIEKRMRMGEKEETLYEVILRYIKRLNNKIFYKRNGEIKESAFYKYAYIDKSTWSELRWNQVVPKKKTLLKLVIALRLNEEEAEDLLHRGSSSFDSKDLRDQIILALIDINLYNPEDVYEVLEEYRLNGSQRFENIYDLKKDKRREEK